MAPGKTSFGYAVIGLGGLGSAAAYWLSKRAPGEVLGLEQFELGHERGESQDHSRIIRLTYHTPEYVKFAQAAYRAWAALEDDAEEQLVVKCGELNFWPDRTTLNEDAFNRSMQVCDVPFERLSAADVTKRFPQFRFDGDIHAIYQPDGGLVGAIKANAAHRRLACRNGATLRDNMPVSGLRQINGGYEISAGGQTFEAEKLIIAAGPWTNRVLGYLGQSVPLKVTHEQVSYFASPHLEKFRPDRFPVWIWMILDNYYGFPAYGAEGVKIAKDRFAPTDPDTRSFDPDLTNQDELRQFLSRHLPEAVGPLLYTKTCLLTHTPDTDFILDRVPGHPNCVATVGATHAFKFASVIGQTMADMLQLGATPHDIAAFRFDRDRLKAGEKTRFEIDGFAEQQCAAH
ncbi:N-methyl-L-tryptophan oxidase [Roseovarius aestuarii]|nr:N-methyl-L-tryptophan oxidase [Roseovarius aestuarii]